MPVKTQAEILAALDKSAQAMVKVNQAAEEAGAVLRDTEPTPIETIRGVESAVRGLGRQS